LETQIKNHESGGKFISDGDLRKEFTQFKKLKGNEWIKEVNNNVTKQAIKDCCKAYKNFFKGQTKFPKFKSKRKSKLSFYVDTHKICFNESQVKMETIGVVDLAESNRIPIGCKYYNPRVSFDGVNFWLSIGCEVDDIIVNNNKTEPIIYLPLDKVNYKIQLLSTFSGYKCDIKPHL
jgi:putative transposase